MAMAMPLGLGLPSPDLGRPSSFQCARRRRVHVRALRDDEAEITSMRDEPLSALTRRVFDWGRQVHQQATEQMQKFFNELADGSILISFGSPGATKKNAEGKAPVRLPSRYAKQFPYTAKRSKQPLTEAAPVKNGPLKTAPARIPSTFSRGSPINKLSTRHFTKGAEEAELRFKDVHIEEEYKQTPPGKIHIIRPPTSFVRKSPIPPGVGRIRGAFKTFDPVEEQVDTAGSETSLVAGIVHPIRPKTAFARKSPIPRVPESGRRRSKAALLEQEITETSVREAVIADIDVQLADEECINTHHDVQLQVKREHSRPATNFIRKSPVPKSTARSKRQRAADQKLEGQTNAGVQGNSSTNEANTSRAFRPLSTFSRKSPISQGKDAGRRRRRRVAEINKEENNVGKWAAGTTTAKKTDQPHADTMNGEKVVQPVIDVSTSKSKSLRPKANFVRKSPITQGKRSRRKTRPIVSEGSNSEVTLTEDEIVRIVLDAADAASQAKVEEPLKAPEVFNMHADATLEQQVEAVDSSGICVSQTSTDVEVVETDVELSDDESPTTNASKYESDLSVLTLRRLKSIAKSRGLKGYSKLRKAELVELLKQLL